MPLAEARRVPDATLAAAMAPIDSQSAQPSRWPRTIRPASAAIAGLTLMNTPYTLAGTTRSARRSATIGTAEHSTPATPARPSASAVT
jgi:hypothetical protein